MVFWTEGKPGKKSGRKTKKSYQAPLEVAGIIDEETFKQAVDKVNDSLSVHNVKVDWRYLSRGSAFAIIAANEALEQVGWRPVLPDNARRRISNRAGVHFGTGMEGIGEVSQTSEAISARRYKGIGPHALTRSLANMPAGVVSRLWGLRGPCMATNTACATGLHSIGDAYRMIQQGEAELVVAGGCEASVFPWAMAAFSRIRALTTQFNDNPSKASRPFDKLRDGFVMAEGAGAMVLQAWPPSNEMEKSTSMLPIAEVVGYGRSGDAHNLVSPDPCGDGAFRSMEAALQDSQTVTMNNIGHINCHATSTPLGDTLELSAIARLLATHPRSVDEPQLVLNSIKGQLGHLLGASGAVESVYTALSVNRGVVVGNCNLYEPIASSAVEQVLLTGRVNDAVDMPPTRECLDALERNLYLPLASVRSVPFPQISASARRVALTNSFGFGGTNGTLLFAEWKE